MKRWRFVSVVIGVLAVTAMLASACDPQVDAQNPPRDITTHLVLSWQHIDQAGNPIDAVQTQEVGSYTRRSDDTSPWQFSLHQDNVDGPLAGELNGSPVVLPDGLKNAWQFAKYGGGGYPSGFGGITLNAEQWSWDSLFQVRAMDFQSHLSWYWAYGVAVLAAPAPAAWAQPFPGCWFLTCNEVEGLVTQLIGFYPYNFGDGGFWPQGGYEYWPNVSFHQCAKAGVGGVGCFPTHDWRNEMFGHGNGTWWINYKQLY